MSRVALYHPPSNALPTAVRRGCSRNHKEAACSRLKALRQRQSLVQIQIQIDKVAGHIGGRPRGRIGLARNSDEDDRNAGRKRIAMLDDKRQSFTADHQHNVGPPFCISFAQEVRHQLLVPWLRETNEIEVFSVEFDLLRGALQQTFARAIRSHAGGGKSIVVRVQDQDALRPRVIRMRG